MKQSLKPPPPPPPPQVISPELCREELHRSLARGGTAQSQGALSLQSAASSVIGVVVVVVVRGGAW
jgi:hypothetical protein